MPPVSLGEVRAEVEPIPVRRPHRVAGLVGCAKLTLWVRHGEGTGMGLFRWFTKNWANTQGPSHPDLAPLVLPLPPAEAAERVKSAVATLLHWRVRAADGAGELPLTRLTGQMEFVD